MEMSEPGNSDSSSQNKRSPAERLKQLKDLLDVDAITQEEYDTKKKSILDQL